MHISMFTFVMTMIIILLHFQSAFVTTINRSFSISYYYSRTVHQEPDAHSLLSDLTFVTRFN